MRGDHTEQTMPRTLHDAVSAPAALTAFLRGVERRGAVFAQLQVGDAATGDRALVAAMRAFRLPAAKIPFADWPRQFWTLLLATPELREQPKAPSWGSGFGALGGIGRGPRAALLLRLVAGLPEAEAAAVLGVARPTYRLALQRAQRPNGRSHGGQGAMSVKVVYESLRSIPSLMLSSPGAEPSPPRGSRARRRPQP